MFNNSILREIYDKHCKMVAAPDARLSLEQMSAVIKTVYFASLRLEEGEKVLPRIFAALTEDKLHQKPIPIIRFKEPQPLSVEWLRKFALSVNKSRSAFLVSFIDGHPVAYGIGHELWQTSRGHHVVRGESSILVEAKGIGIVSISVSGTQLGTLRDGDFFRTARNLFEDRNFKKSACTALSLNWFSPDKQDSVVENLAELVQMASLIQRGGTIVVLQNQFAQDALKFVEAGTAVVAEHPQNGQGAIQFGYRRDVLNITNADGIDPDRRRYLQFLAQLSAIDGALIINENFEPLMIGAKLKAPQYSGPLHLGGSTDNTQSTASQTVGTRHTSATNFVAAVPGCIAFVISSDGPIRGLVHQDNAVALWKDAVGG
jgi:DisA bacterial checkpoint controller nucleotide-binding